MKTMKQTVQALFYQKIVYTRLDKCFLKCLSRKVYTQKCKYQIHKIH